MKQKITLKTQQKYFIISIIIFFVAIGVYFLPFTLSGKTLDGDDLKYPSEDFFLNFSNFGGSWTDHTLLGGGGYSKGRIDTLIFTFFPPAISSSLVYILAIFLTFLGSFLFFRANQLSFIPSILTGWFLAFTPTYFTYIRTGHIGKMYAIGFALLAFAFTTRILKGNTSWKLILLNGIALSLGVLTGAVQTYAYFILIYLLYIAYHLLWEVEGKEEKRGLIKNIINKLVTQKKSILSLLISGLLSIVLSLEGIKSNLTTLLDLDDNSVSELIPIQESKEPAKQMSPEQNWNWATQWSLPKAETIDFFLPGIFGLTSHDPNYPYWGKVGQTPGWEQHRQGYQNYSYASNYLGILIACFFFYALFHAPKRIRWFWGSVSLLLLLLSYGRFFFLYEWFYQLPYMEKLRNPNKFILVLYPTIGILAGYGAQAYYQKYKEYFKNQKPKQQLKPDSFFLRFLILSIVLLTMALLFVSVQKSVIMITLSNFFPFKTANLIMGNLQSYLVRGIFLFLTVNLILAYLPKLTKNYLTIALLFLGILGFLDTYLVNYKFFKIVDIPPTKARVNDPVARFFMDQQNEPYRFKILQEGQYIQYFKWNLAPRYGISSIDVRTLRTGMPADYQAYFNHLRYGMKFLRLANVKYTLSMRPINDPNMEQRFVQDFPAVKERVFVHEIKNTLPRVYLRGNYETGDSLETTVKRMGDPSFKIEETVMLHKRLLDNPTLAINQVTPSINASLKLLDFDPKKFYRVSVSTDTPQIMVLGNKYHANWRAFDQDGRKLPHFPVNYFFNGYLVNPESKEIVLKYSISNSERFFSFITLLNYLLLIVLLIQWVRGRTTKPSVKTKKS